MTRSRGVNVSSPAISWVRHPVAVPVGAALLAVALLCGVGWVAVHEASSTVQRDAQNRVRSNRDAAVRALVREIDDFQRTIATASVSKVVIEGLRAPVPENLGAVQDQLSALARSQNSPAAFLSDAKGRNVAIYPVQPELVGKDFSFRDWFQGASRTGRPYVSSAYVSAASGHPLVVGVSAPVFDGSHRIGYVTVLWQLESVRAVAEGAHRDDDVAIAVTDQRGQPLTASLIVDDRGQPLQAPVSVATTQALAGRSVSTIHDGVLEAAGPVPGSGWTVTASQPSSVAMAPAATFQRILRTTVGVGILLLLLATALGLRFALRRAADRAAVRDSEERFRRVFDESLIGTFLVNSDGAILRVNATLAELLGREPQQFVGQTLEVLFDDASDQVRVLKLIETGEGELRAEMTLRDAEGRQLCGLTALTWMRELDGKRVLLAQVEDITARRAAEQRLNDYALHDELTSLPNRRLLLERCEHAFARAKSGRGDTSSVAALFIDLDGFKAINDRAGHDAGDQVLIAVANDLKSMLRPTDTVARIGGDEFIVLLEQDDGLEYLRTVAGRITTTIRRQISTDTDPLALSASVGIARVDLVHEPDVSPDQLLRRADAAMYRAKERGRDQYDVFDADLLQRTEARQVLVQAIRDGLRHDRLALVFQPIVDVDSNIIVGAEALMRLSNAEGRLMPTLPAIVAAEVAGLAEAVGDRVLDRALAAARTWPADMSLAVNISARELTGRDLRNRVEQAHWVSA
jgi:diguanylate cyclase (GGDEF)-like protein/PAS domain S-box-containing protein